MDSSPPLNFASLSEATQDRIYDFLDTIRVDDRLGFFMRRRFYKAKRLQSRETLAALVDLVDQSEAEARPPPKKDDDKKKKKKKN